MNSRNLLSAIAGALLFCLLAGCGGEKPTEAKQRNANDVLNVARLKQLTKDLTLTSEQSVKVQALLDEEAKGVVKVQDDASLSVMDRSTKVTALRDTTAKMIKPLLTPAQLEKYEEMLRKGERRKRSR